MVECVNVEENVNVEAKSKNFKSLPSLIKKRLRFVRALNINAIEFYNEQETQCYY